MKSTRSAKNVDAHRDFDNFDTDVVFQICESEMGGEWIAEKHRTWFDGPRMPDTEKSIIDRLLKSE